MATIYGTTNSETLDAADGVTNNNDTIFGSYGNDSIYGLGGNDVIFGGDGNDVIIGGSGADTIYGDSGFDMASYINSGSGVSVSLLSGAGTGGPAEGDKLYSIEGLVGSSYDDLLVGDDEANELSGLSGNDNLKGSGGDDVLFGGADNDMLKGGGGEDKLHGGSGIDTAAYNQSGEGVNVILVNGSASGGDAQGDELDGIENLIGSSYEDHLGGDNGVNVLKGENGNDLLKGYGGQDTLFGGNQNDTLFGLADDDMLYGDGGNDTLYGGTGDDTMHGGYGDDTFVVDSAGDVVIEATNQGNDTVKATVSYELANDVRVETLRTINDAATTAIDLTGNSYANTIVGNAGANTLDGKGGADTMQGLGGDDTYYVNNAGDNVHEAAGQGADTVRASVNYQLTAGQEVEALTTTSNNGVTAINLTGNNKAQTIVGNAGFNVLQGNGGDDYLQGRAGHDTLTGGAGEDKFLFNTTLNAATNVDTITDMTAGVDLIRLDDAFFAGIGPVGVLSADAFHIGATAADAEDRIVYNSATGQLFFDSNGNAAGGSTLFANLATGLALTNTDFHIV